MAVDFFIQTSIDKLICLLREKKRLKLSDAAKTLKVTQKKIDEWVFMLEDKGIVDLKYPILGEPEIVLKHEVSEEALIPRRDIKVDTRIIPGKPIKKEELPVFKPSNIPEGSYSRNVDNTGYEGIMDELKSLEGRISDMASKRSDRTDPTNVYITEKLKFLESKLHELSKREEGTETEKMILEKLEKIENRMDAMSKKVNKEEPINELERNKKVKLKGTDDV
jgi:hypothetical protein